MQIIRIFSLLYSFGCYVNIYVLLSTLNVIYSMETQKSDEPCLKLNNNCLPFFRRVNMRGNLDGKTNRRVEISIAGTASLTNLHVRTVLQNRETQSKQCITFEHGVMMSPRVRYLIFSIYLIVTDLGFHFFLFQK